MSGSSSRFLGAALVALVSWSCAGPVLVAQAPHWAFVAPEKHVPAGDDAWCRDDIDRFVLQGLRARGVSPSPEADRELLLRRVHLVLTGLPPSPEQVSTFVADRTSDAYERRVDELLCSDACAEHLAVDWLDLARFADTYGYQSDFECRTWPWRDWLIRSFAADKKWDQFVREIVAGDLLADATDETRTATAFWRLHRQTNEGGSIEEEWRHEYIADRVDTLGAAFLGLTVGCARCHDHKFDPVSQRDYYSLGSFFAIDESGLAPYSTGGVPQPAMRLATAEQQTAIAALQGGVAAAQAALASVMQTERTRASSQACAEPVPIVHYPFEEVQDGKSADLRRQQHPATVPPELRLVPGPRGKAIEADGDAPIGIPGAPAFRRDDAFSLTFWLWCPEAKPRAVLVHTSNYTEDADTQGYQVLLQDGHLCWQIVHHWPGSAIALRADDALPLQRWLQVAVTYDGSSRASGLRIFVDGRLVAASIERDHLAGPATVHRLELVARDRDRGFAGGRIDEFRLFDRCLTAAEVALAGGLTPTPEQCLEHNTVRSAAVVALATTLHDARLQLHRTVEAMPELMVMAPNAQPPQRFVLRRGAYDQPDTTRPVQPDVPAAVLPWAPSWPRDRRGLSSWLNAPEQPLASRVVVDRLWSLCFGRGLVQTPENFGVATPAPLQQALLDALACDFTAGRSVRALLRRLVTSATFRQSSTCTAAARAADPDNELLARGPSFRLAAEVLRDQALAASGLLDRTVGGPSCRPWQPPGLWKDAGAAWSGADYTPDTGAQAHRRSLYTFQKRTSPPPDMAVLDAPSRETCLVRRQCTSTPLQTLVFLNDPVFTECADALAQRVLAELPQASLDEQLQLLFVALASRRPRPAELRALRMLHAANDDAQQAFALVASTLMASDAVVVLR